MEIWAVLLGSAGISGVVACVLRYLLVLKLADKAIQHGYCMRITGSNPLAFRVEFEERPSCEHCKN